MNDSYLLELRNLQKTFCNDIFKRDKEEVLKDLSCGFRKGVCTGLLGHNGAGKTTAIRMILGLIKPDRGQILFEDRPIKPLDRRNIGYMPEVNRIPVQLTSLEILKYHLRFYNLKKGTNKNQLIKERLTQVRLWDHRNKKVSQLSKGMARRLAWVMATIHSPKLLILDEPFSGLDPMGRLEMRSWLTSLKRANMTIILSTHEVWAMEALCDEVFVVREGEMVYSTVEEKRKELTESPKIKTEGRYSLEVSGADIVSLTEFCGTYALPVWQEIKQDGYLITMEFQSYNELTKWVPMILERGYVITRFGLKEKILEETILKYFKGIRK